jgi:hypothetical protein
VVEEGGGVEAGAKEGEDDGRADGEEGEGWDERGKRRIDDTVTIQRNYIIRRKEQRLISVLFLLSPFFLFPFFLLFLYPFFLFHSSLYCCAETYDSPSLLSTLFPLILSSPSIHIGYSDVGGSFIVSFRDFLKEGVVERRFRYFLSSSFFFAIKGIRFGFFFFFFFFFFFLFLFLLLQKETQQEGKRRERGRRKKRK